MDTPVKVPLRIYAGLKHLRATGTNMNDYHQVLAHAEKNGNVVLTDWLRNNMKYYMLSTIYGLEADGSKNSYDLLS
ncbi:hypothetical protein SPFL3102_03502 [Sporomusaceae bacterium FL31]|nr:hypothetical protein SPFL3101_02375 [Sporomusaceae bacterium FL31]GCE35651.1 hypothetical protein SPFL3102_03502 [Sporomusaceae bacterium]